MRCFHQILAFWDKNYLEQKINISNQVLQEIGLWKGSGKVYTFPEQELWTRNVCSEGMYPDKKKKTKKLQYVGLNIKTIKYLGECIIYTHLSRGDSFPQHHKLVQHQNINLKHELCS